VILISSGRRWLAAGLALLASAALWAQPVSPAIVLASTTSTEQSGLFAHLLPLFQRATGISVKVVAVGSGQAIDMARRGDADVLLAHDRPAEERLVADGFALRRIPVMYNDFVLIGPAADPARARGRDIVQALRQVRQQGGLFVSRGDRSGTHSAELRFWQLAQIEPAVSGAWGAYRACGCGMGQALNMAASLDAYVLADRGTWLAFGNRAGLALLVEGDSRLFNPYGVMAVNPARHPHVRHAHAQQFVDWITGPAGQAAIAAFRIGGQPLFFPNAPGTPVSPGGTPAGS
jgi:tungstate transport system substrate-binding protein